MQYTFSPSFNFYWNLVSILILTISHYNFTRVASFLVCTSVSSFRRNKNIVLLQTSRANGLGTFDVTNRFWHVEFDEKLQGNLLQQSLWQILAAEKTLSSSPKIISTRAVPSSRGTSRWTIQDDFLLYEGVFSMKKPVTTTVRSSATWWSVEETETRSSTKTR